MQLKFWFERVQEVALQVRYWAQRREYSLGEITGLYGILIGVAWSNDLLTSGQQVNLHMTVDFVAPNVRTYNELAMAFDAFSSVVSSACIV